MTVTRMMADGEGINASAVIAAGTDLVAVYVTGTAGIRWAPYQILMIPAGRTIVTIDQGSAGSPVGTADVRDVENGAWTPDLAVDLAGWDAPRPTIYCSAGTLPAVLAAGWTGALWLAIPGWDGDQLPDTGACEVVAVQDQYNGTYDLSSVLDPAWPEGKENEMYVTIEGIPGQWINPTQFYDPVTFTAYVVGVGTTGHVYMTKSINGGDWSSPVVI
jgi:hypothetical protein